MHCGGLAQYHWLGVKSERAYLYVSAMFECYLIVSSLMILGPGGSSYKEEQGKSKYGEGWMYMRAKEDSEVSEYWKHGLPLEIVALLDR